MAKMLNQVELIDFNDNSRLFCWLQLDSRIKVGVRITLKEIPKRDWIVNKIFKTQIEAADMNRSWKVGGLK